MGQAMATLLGRSVTRDDDGRKSLLCNHSVDNETSTGSFFKRCWQLFHALIRRLMGRGTPKPPSDPPSCYLNHAYEEDYARWHCSYDDYGRYYVAPVTEHCLDIGDDGLIPGETHEVATGVVTEDTAVRRSSPPLVAEDKPVSRRTSGTLGPYSCRQKISAETPDAVRESYPPPVAEEKPISRRTWGKLGPYRWGQKILLVGEGDFSFSASLAVAFGDASNMVATSLDSFDFLMKNYSSALKNTLELTSKNCKVMHGIDATKMANHPELNSVKFDSIVYNFPHAGFSNRKGSRQAQIRLHQELVSGFLENAKKMIKDDGQIHITHKCAGFLLEWNIAKLGSSQGLRLVGESPFDLKQYPGYNTKYGYGGDKNFDWKPAKTYKFRLAEKKPVISGSSPSLVEQPKKLGSYMYNADQMMLLVGEGDFSFAASLAVAFGDASNMVATSLDSLEFLKKNYKRAENNIMALTTRGCKVMYGVDATTMAVKQPQLRSLKFNCIVFNFPRAVFSANSKPPRNEQIKMHQGLISAFLKNAKQMIRDEGQIHVTHQCFKHYLQWSIEKLGSSEGLQLVEGSPFDSKDYPGYCAKYGSGGDGSFGCNPAVTYKFQLSINPGNKKTRRPRKK